MKNEHIRFLESQIENDPLAAIDKILEAFSRVLKKDLHLPKEKLFHLLGAAVCRSKPASEAKDLQVTDLFSRDLHPEQRRLGAISLLRLIALCPTFLDDQQMSIRALQLFDAAISNDLYRTAGVTVKDQGYRKREALVALVPDIEQRLGSLVDSIHSLSSLNHCRQQIAQCLNHQSTKAVVGPFLPRDLTGPRFQEIFQLVGDYLGASEESAISAYEQARMSLEEYQSDAHEHGTVYSQQYLESIGGRLTDLLNDHFRESPYSKPAQLKAERPQKKFPLHEVGREIRIPIRVRNSGPGYARSVELRCEADDPLKGERISGVYIGNLPPGVAEVEIPVSVAEASEHSVDVLTDISWENFDGSMQSWEGFLDIEPQRADIDWDSLENEDPYSLEAVSTEEDLIGREEVLGQLVSQVAGERVGAFYIYGQRRVGTTSVALTLKSRLEERDDHEMVVVYLEVGDFIHPNPQATITALGESICDEIKRLDPRFAGLSSPAFDGALSPITRFLSEALKIAPKCKFLFVLDEFDKLPEELYRHTPEGNAFFLTLRSLSRRPQHGIILVGGEDLEYIMNFQGGQLNKCDPMGIDYLTRPDFAELVRRPVARWFEVSDDGIAALWDVTAGNPYFTKFVCLRLFRMMVERRDCYVSEREVMEAVRRSLVDAKGNSVQHFWEDGIFEEGDHKADRLFNRRLLLLTMAGLFRAKTSLTVDAIQAQLSADGLELPAGKLIKEFERRRVLSVDGEKIKCRLPFFQRWLSEKGFREIIATDTEYAQVFASKQKEEEAYIRSEEIVDIVDTWPTYRGKAIGEDRVRAWLHQFGDNRKQRLVWNILIGLKFYSMAGIRERMSEAHNIVTRGIVQRVERLQRKRGDLLVSYLGPVGKSGAEYARVYADENSIYVDNIVELDGLNKRLADPKRAIEAVVLLDDFIASGDSCCSFLEELEERSGELIRKSQARIVLVAVCGFQSAKERIERMFSDLGISASVHLCDPMDDRDRCFADNSRFYEDLRERERARQICKSIGSKLVGRAPLGYGGCQAAVVFPNTCPNNSLPVLWKTAREWKALFPRL